MVSFESFSSPKTDNHMSRHLHSYHFIKHSLKLGLASYWILKQNFHNEYSIPMYKQDLFWKIYLFKYMIKIEVLRVGQAIVTMGI